MIQVGEFRVGSVDYLLWIFSRGIPDGFIYSVGSTASCGPAFNTLSDHKEET